MSFAERNKRWLLPFLGVTLAGVAWMSLMGRPAPVPPSVPAMPPAAPPEDPKAAEDPALEYGADLVALQAPPPAANDPRPLLQAGRMPLAEADRAPANPAVLHPEHWKAFYDPPPPKPPPRQVQAAGPLPRPDFILESEGRREAWIGGRLQEAGADLGGGYTLKEVARAAIVVSGPAGDVDVPLRASPPALGKAGHP